MKPIVKKTILLGNLFVALGNLSILGITTGLSCLYNPQSGMKLAILYDQHMEQLSSFLKTQTIEKLLKTQKAELEQLVDTLSKTKQEPVFFIIECDPVMKESILQAKDEDMLPILFVIQKIFFEKDITVLGNAEFKCADPRSRIDRVAATNFIVDFDYAYKRLQEGSLVDWAVQITIGSYLNHIMSSKKRVFKEIDSIGFITAEAKKKAKASAKKAYDKVVAFIGDRMNIYNLKKSNHLLELYKPLLKKEENYYLFSRIVDWGNVLFDVRLLRLIETIQKQTHKIGSKIIVQAGQFHARLLEYRLMRCGFKLCSRHGNVESLTVDEDEMVQSKKSLEKDIEKSVNLGLTGVDTLIINCFTNYSFKACTNERRGLWATIKKWLGYE